MLAPVPIGPVPTPIGVGPRYHPRPAVHAVCAPAPLREAWSAHIELFATRRAIVVPAGIGVLGGRRVSGRIVRARCRATVWTLDPSGVVRFAAPVRPGRLFAVWGQALGPSRLLGFRGSVRTYRNSVAWHGDPRRLNVRDRDQIVLQTGGYVRPHRSYRFPRH
jgi:hypothetical protein